MDPSEVQPIQGLVWEVVDRSSAPVTTGLRKAHRTGRRVAIPTQIRKEWGGDRHPLSVLVGLDGSRY